MKDQRTAPTVENVLSVTRTLWPESSVDVVRGMGFSGASHQVRDFVLIPHRERPRLLLPGSAPAAAATAVRRYSHALSYSERVVRAVGALVLRTGAADGLFRDRVRVRPVTTPGRSSIETVLAEILGGPVRVSLGLGNQRANQKPVLQVMTPTGAPLAFVKVGHNSVTRSLVRAEERALTQLSELHLPGIRVPRVIDLHVWRDLDLLVLSALRTTVRRHHRLGRLPTAAFVQLASAPGLQCWPLGDSTYITTLHTKVENLTESVAARRLDAQLTALGERYGADVLTFGAWHGDWTPWNMSWEGSDLALWDWERFALGVPLGFDALHYQLRVLMTRLGGAPPAGAALCVTGPRVLASLGVPRDLSPAVLGLYLIELAARYTDAAAGPTGGPLRDFAEWLLGFATRPELIV